MVFQLLLSMFQIPRFCVPVDKMSKGFNKIEGVSNFEKSIQLYQLGAISPLFLGGKRGVWGCVSPEYFEISKP